MGFFATKSTVSVFAPHSRMYAGDGFDTTTFGMTASNETVSCGTSQKVHVTRPRTINRSEEAVLYPAAMIVCLGCERREKEAKLSVEDMKAANS